MPFRDELPVGCPPTNSLEIAEQKVFFRLVKTAPAVAQDFISWKMEYPHILVKAPLTDCQARGVSVFSQRADCEKVLKLKNMKGRRIYTVTLAAGAGHILSTPSTRSGPSHHTWWPFADYDILGNCTESVV